MTIVTPRGQFMAPVQRKAMNARSNGHSIIMTETRGMSEELGNDGRPCNIINEWRIVHPTHCSPVAQLCSFLAAWAMAEPSHQKLLGSSSRVTARLPAAWQDFRVAAWVLLCVCACFARLFVAV